MERKWTLDSLRSIAVLSSREGEWSFKVLALDLQKVGFEVVKCDKHSSLDQLDRTAYRSRHGTDN